MIYFYNDKDIFDNVVLKEINNSENKDKLFELILKKKLEFNNSNNNIFDNTKDAPENIWENNFNYKKDKGNVDKNDEIKHSLINENEQKINLNCAPIISDENKIENKDYNQINSINQFNNNILINNENAQTQNLYNNNINDNNNNINNTNNIKNINNNININNNENNFNNNKIKNNLK